MLAHSVLKIGGNSYIQHVYFHQTLYLASCLKAPIANTYPLGILEAARMAIIDVNLQGDSIVLFKIELVEIL
jgi:hypothetical protein